jgi:hypothetical protein
VLVNTEQGLRLINEIHRELERYNCAAEVVFHHNHRRPFCKKKGASRAFYKDYRDLGIGAILAQYGQYNSLGKTKSLFFRIVGEEFKPQMLTRLYQAVKRK